MLTRKLSVAIYVWLAAGAAAFGQSYIFQLAGQTGPVNQALGLVYNDFTRFVNTNAAIANAFQVVSTPNGARFYMVAPGGIQSANSTFTAFTTVTGIAGTVRSAVVTPDGKYLLVVTDQHIYVIETTGNTISAIDPGVSNNGGTPTAVAVSHDGKTVWVLGATGSGSTLTAVNMTTFQSGATLDMGTLVGNTVTLSPKGLLYVTFQAQLLYEIDPATMTITSGGAINVPGLASAPKFTPDGNTAYMVNLNVCPTCNSVFKLTGHSVVGAGPSDVTATPPQLTDVFVGGNGQVFAFSPNYPTTKLWDVTASPFALAPSVISFGLPINNILSVAISNERPSPRFLYVLTQDNNNPLRRISLTGDATGEPAAVPQSGILWFDAVPALSGGSTFFLLNPSVSVGSGAVSAPLIAQLVDGSGRPVFNQQVTFTADPSSGLVINTPSQVTGAEGFAQTTITAPATQGTFLVQVTSGAASATFTVVVGSGTNPGGSSPQMTIYSGDGQLLRQNNSTLVTQPLTVKVTDTAGNPLPNIAVSFAVSQGVGSVNTEAILSGDDGLAAANFSSGIVAQDVAFQATSVVASSIFGSVEFIETTYNALQDDIGQPSFQIIEPDNLQLTIPQGGSLPNGIVAKTINGHFPQVGVPIPNLGIRLAEPSDLSNSKVVSCAGSTRGDNQGVSRCNVQAACQVGTFLPRSFGVVIAVGEAKFSNMLVTITAGTASLLTPTTGNGATGHPGDPLILQARVTDGCGQPVSGVTVSWAVTQGTATVTPTQPVSQADGIVSARLVFGNTAGPITVTASGANLTAATFQLTNTVQVSSVALVSGGGQSAVVGQAFANPVVFVVRDANNAPVPGLLVNFSVTGNATINPGSATTNAAGLVQTSVTAGTTADTITVRATYNALFATAVLSSRLPGPEVTNSSFRNAASLAVGMTPCGLVTVSGNGIAPTVQGVVSGLSAFGPLPYTLAGVSIDVQQGLNTYHAPMQAVANLNGIQQANFQAPCELTAGNATVVITVNNASATVLLVPVLAVQPGIFTYAGPNNKLYGAVIRAVDGSYVTPSNPARRGERLYMVVTGLGQVTPATVTNAVGTGSQNVNLPIVVGVSDRGTAVLSARYLAGSIGAYLIEFQISSDAPTGADQSLAVAALTNNGTTFVFGNPAFLPAVAP